MRVIYSMFANSPRISKHSNINLAIVSITGIVTKASKLQKLLMMKQQTKLFATALISLSIKNGLTICLKVLKKRVAYGTVKIFTHQAEKGETSMHSITKKPLRMLLK